MNHEKRNQRALFDQLPAEWSQNLLPAIQEQLHQDGRKVIVLDDDPTGTQTVHHLPVLTEWPVERLISELEDPGPAVYLLTNSRSLPPEQARTLNIEIGTRLSEAGQRSRRGFVVVSRSDSTLRGHFPGEVAALAEGLGDSFDAWLLVPFFPEGGRYTIDDVHYVAEGDWLVPAGQTEFARDKAFGYQSSHLGDWVTEKMGPTFEPKRIAAISLADLRQGGPQAVTQRLLQLPKGSICYVNAASYRDMEVLVLGLLAAEAQGRRYLYRTAAAFVRVRAGITPRPLLTAADLNLKEQGAGLIIAGSYVPKTSAQLEALFQESNVARVEVNVRQLLDVATRATEIERARQAAERHLLNDHDTVIYTSRELISSESAEGSLSIGQTVSEALVAILRGLEARPRYVLAKGGITSSDIATRGLGIRRAVVLGQVLPGVPVWQCGPETRCPGMPYIVFPGNVGGPDALARVVKGLAREKQ